MPVEFTPEAKQELDDILNRYEERRAALLPVLHLAQREFGYISPEVEEYVASIFELTPIHVREVVTFYTLYQTSPPGKHMIRICRTVACHFNGAPDLISHLRAKTGCTNGDTSEDGLFTVKEVECLGACEKSPMMQVDEEYIGPLTIEKIDAVIDGLRKS